VEGLIVNLRTFSWSFFWTSGSICIQLYFQYNDKFSFGKNVAKSL